MCTKALVLEKSKLDTVSQTSKNDLCLFLAEQVCDPGNLSNRTPYHLFELLIVNSLTISFNWMNQSLSTA